ncbi:HD domain-containing protein [Oenococcus sp.]|uniref:HD domain-containing protein n=1 Tax=Oenococcus sp. TaxID=1979414 RepID=UPI0039ECCFDD
MTSLKSEKVFRDPILGFIHVDNSVILDLINSHEMQRLRRIKHLGVANLVFHGGEQSRFQHSLGVYEISRRMIDALDHNKQLFNEKKWEHQNDLLVQAAALLHDVGHGAYSHTFEHLFNTVHEQFTQKIITDPSTEVNAILRRVSKDFPAKVAAVIGKTYPDKRVVQLISSQLDADRMDYLLRDAYYTGAEYGRYDIERILRLIRPVKDGFAFDIAGVHSIEDYVISRYQMYLQVYFHPVSRGMEVVLENLLMRAQELFDQNPDNPIFFQLLKPIFALKNKIDVQDYIALDDSVFNTAFNIWQNADDPVLADLAKRFLDRKPLKSMVLNAQTKLLLADIKQKIAALGFDPKYYTGENDATDLPYESYSPKTGEEGIKFVYPNGEQAELSQLSPLVAAINGKESIDRRFFFPRELLADKEVNDLYLKYKKTY